LIHAHNYHAFPALFAALTKKENKFVFSPHYHAAGHSFFRNMLHKPYKLLGRKTFERADVIICVSNYEKSLVLNNFNVANGKIHIIPNGVNLDEFKDVDKMKEQKDRRVKRVLYVGRIEKYKGLDYVVKSLIYLPDDFTLEIVGKGNYKSKIVEIARKLGVIDRVRFYKDLSRKELVEKYAKADVLVLLSRHEAYGIVVAEALAAKTPCVVANTSALSEWIDNKNVFGVDYPINVSELAKLIEIVSNVKVENVKLLDWDEVVKRFMSLCFF
jgi:glycosyltransferase involved in cell wall biosynthesis